ncbi:nuclear transport factor 2 family protein [Xanthobacter aminoxidans]|uniref:nuclear transport factor 2 family protein n=1 Tax=Xanthobacter aminoxidans TaxID=186280 RepID=UPI00372AEA2C
MTIILPEPIAAYFEADGKDGAAVAKCFTENAVVIDERQTHSGQDAIRQWKTEASAKYRYVSEPHTVDQKGDHTVVTSRLTGNFPGSPVDLRYAFTLSGDRIARLEITL